ncbi:hypothetical protein EXT46_05315 [Pseudoalteromonas sp. CO325X]|uniref:HI1506-related protein n=1 Tax=Pseudoalteromonas sp. CO325X TaxID=1777262 RepID=UPI0010231FE7|nr:HI1506-related protein [Pseudoalteromonas sp. CO325X]RZF83713.1 hypothetical protein EXT46_05315 [Pseudoalteromonas sp. CO325X]
MAKKFVLSAIASVMVTSTQPDGYRRAGFALKQGQNDLPVDQLTEKSLLQLDEDPRLAVEVVSNGENPDGESNVDTGSLGPALTDIKAVDIEPAPEELAPLVALLIDGNFTDKPTCKDLTYETQGKEEGSTVKITPSAAERDAAWDWLQTQLRTESE